MPESTVEYTNRQGITVGTLAVHIEEFIEARTNRIGTVDFVADRLQTWVIIVCDEDSGADVLYATIHHMIYNTDAQLCRQVSTLRAAVRANTGRGHICFLLRKWIALTDHIRRRRRI